jgi:ABC-type branched-subunit amino acid transport system substrate-binding protein
MTVQEVLFEASNPLALATSVPDAEVLLVAGNFANEQALAPILLTQKWLYAAFIGAGTSEVLAGMGELREGLIGPAQWLASAALVPDEGPDALWLVARYQQQTGEEPPYPAVQAFAAGLVAARCVRTAGSCEDEALLAVARGLRCTTLYGPFELDTTTGLQMGHRVVVVQWQEGERQVVWPPDQTARRIRTWKEQHGLRPVQQ